MHLPPVHMHSERAPGKQPQKHLVASQACGQHIANIPAWRQERAIKEKERMSECGGGWEDGQNLREDYGGFVEPGRTFTRQQGRYKD